MEQAFEILKGLECHVNRNRDTNGVLDARQHTSPPTRGRNYAPIPNGRQG
jgi:hypothetical protein